MPGSRQEPTRGRSGVESALVDAACELLAEAGPTATSVRDVAKRAGVNHAQVHHYFGGKRELLKAAMRQMAQAHTEALVGGSGDRRVPPPLTMPSEQYLRAIVRATIEGDIELAGLEIHEGGPSVWREVLEVLTARAGLDEPNTDVKAALAAGAALQLGWLALEPIIFLVAGVSPDEEDEVRERVKRTVARVQRQVGDGHQPSQAASLSCQSGSGSGPGPGASG